VAKEQEEIDPDKIREMRLKTEARGRWPGLLLFRQSKKGPGPAYLAVLLIGESPISGVNKTQLANALAYIPDGISPPILGPCFSGSAASLDESIGESHHKVGTILSGSATRLQGRGSSTQHDDVFAMTKLLSYLSGLERDQSLNLALVHEGATEYGSGLSSAVKGRQARATGKITDIGFPKDIARLRNVYEDNQMWAKPQAGSPAPNASSGLTLKLRDDLSGRDSVPSYSSAQTPLAQDAGLNEIASILKLDKIRTAGVIATDVMDTIFVMRYLHTACPDVHLFTVDSDLLVARSGDSVSLLGTLAATTYPLFPASQDWTSNDRHMVFDSAISEGVYNAMRLLLHAEGASEEYMLSDYSRPFTPRSPVPPLWLMVVARNGYRPVSLLADGTADPMIHHAQTGSQPAQEGTEKPNETSPRVWILIFGCVAALCALWVIAIIAAQRANWRPLTDFNLRPQETCTADRAAILSVGTASMAGLMLVAFSAPLKFISKAEIGAGQWDGMFAIGAVVLPALIALEIWLVRKAFKSAAGQKLRSRSVAVGAVAGLAAFGLAWNHLLWSDGNLRSFFFIVRGVDLVSGVSPLLPFLLLLPAFAIWSWVALQRRIFTDERRPKLPGDVPPAGVSSDTALEPIAPLAEIARVSIDEAIVSVTARTTVKGGIVFTIAFGVVFWGSISYLHSFEQTTFDWVFRVAVSLLAGIIFLAWGQFLVIWRRFQLWLEQLELHPLRYALTRLPSDKSWSPMWVRQSRKRNYVITARSLETLDCLVQEGPDHQDLPARLKDLAAKIFKAAARGNRECIEDSRDLHNELGKAASLLQTAILEPQWKKGGSDALDSMAGCDEWKDALKKTACDADEQRPYVLASEFVALRYVAYIRYVSLHLENLLAFMSGGFILMVLSLSSYPFLSPHLIGWMFGIMFVILGVGVFRVFAQMDRDATLSRLTKTDAGKLGGAFYVKLASFGALPALTLLSAYFPPIGNFLGSLVQPAVQALH
jgi:hypothetical protein